VSLSGKYFLAHRRDRLLVGFSLLAGKLTGNFTVFWPFRRFWQPISEQIQGVAAKFPKLRAGNFSDRAGNFSTATGNLLR
jgi:hypothetical protein